MWWATKKPIVTLVSDASMTPSLQTTPTVVVPFRVRLLGMFDIFPFLPILFLCLHVQNSSGIRSVVFSCWVVN